MFVVEPDSWEATRYLIEKILPTSSWAFRGHSDESWKLETTFERAAVDFNLRPIAELRTSIEAEMIWEFQRRAHHYVSNPPSPDQHLEWLALIQHYEGPTRLLDF
jgi:hypothetical protein